MNSLQRLIKLGGSSIRRIAKEEGVGYHSLQKTIKGVRRTETMQDVIASRYRVNRKALFGAKAEETIRYLMEREINRQAESRRDELKRRYLA